MDNAIAYLYGSEEYITPITENEFLVHIYSEETDVCNLGVYPYYVFPTLVTLNSTVSLEKSGIGKVQRNPNLALFGSGILVGIIDTGIDYLHPAFLYSDDTSRIVSIWDQTIQNGPPPNGFPFGTEYSREQINLALKSKNPLTIVPSMDENGHGTAIASIAAGSQNLENDFSGIVPSSEIAVVKLKPAKQKTKRIYFVPEDALCYQESDLIFATEYLLQVANQLKRPIAICMAVGTSQNGHDGRGATSRYLELIAQRPQVGISIAGGNEGNNQRHYFGTVSSDTFTDEMELKVSSKDKTFAFEIWSYAPSRLGIDIITPSGESTREIFPRFNVCRKYDFIYEPSLVWVNNIILEEETGDQLILIRLENPLEGIWRFKLRNLENEVSSFHAWLPTGDLISRDTFFLESNPDTTITSPGNSLGPITVTAYNQGNDSILLESGRGYTRNNKIKPDIASPGYQLTCAILNGGYGAITGTGAATAYTTGIVAMILEWAVLRGNYTSITGIEISSLIKRGATRDEGIVYPNNIWGYGRIDIDGLFQKLKM